MVVENARPQSELLKKVAQLAALQETTQAMVGTLDLNALLTLIVQQATALLQAEGGVLNMADLDAGEDEVVASIGSTEKFIGVCCPLDESLSGWVTLHNQPVISNRVEEDPRVAHIYTNMIQAKLKNALAAPLSVKGKMLGSLVIVDKLGGDQNFTRDDLNLLVSFASQAAAAIENARLFQAEQRRAEQFRVIGEVIQQISSAVDVDHLVQQMASLIQQSFSYDHVGIGLIEGDEVVSKAEVGAYADIYRDARIKLGQGIWGMVATQGQASILPDVKKDDHFHSVTGISGIRSHLCVPLKTKDEVIGVLSAASDRLKAFDEGDLVVFQSLALQAAVAIENIRYHEHAQETAILEERNRLARELHDAVTQTIFSASLLAEALPEVWKKDPQEGLNLIQELRDLSRGALAEMRTLLLELRPAALAETRLEDLLRQLGEAASGQAGIPVRVAIEGQGDIPAEVHIALYRIAQEALNNVVKHARASQVSVRLCYSCMEEDDLEQPPEPGILLIVHDDGCGFSQDQTLLDHLGLGIMQERADSIGASLTVESQPGEGTQVTVLWEEGANV